MERLKLAFVVVCLYGWMIIISEIAPPSVFWLMIGMPWLSYQLSKVIHKRMERRAKEKFVSRVKVALICGSDLTGKTESEAGKVDFDHGEVAKSHSARFWRFTG